MNFNESQIGAVRLTGGICGFLVWAPFSKKVALHVVKPRENLIPLATGDSGYHQAILDELAVGSQYFYRLDDGRDHPDPASRFQPSGVHGPSQVTADDYDWQDSSWSGLELKDYIIYELHVGTFTPEGTLAAASDHLEELHDLGITAVELMPLAQFPGTRNWGYDGVYPFAVQNSYGGPEALRAFVNKSHGLRIAVVLDVVYNHLGPEGGSLGEFGPYFTDKFRTPWGPAVNFDGPFSDEVRRYFLENAECWVRDFHVDALRLDAVQTICDLSARPFLRQLADAVHGWGNDHGRKVFLIPENDTNDPKLVNPSEVGGSGLDAMWNDDFHHSLHTLLTCERHGYYQDYGDVEQLAKALNEGFVYTGEYSRYRVCRYGASSIGVPSSKFVVFSQNHDQVGNRVTGERLGTIATFEKLKLAAAVTLLSPFIPLLFMGEEYAELAPFLYFVSHEDKMLIDKVRKGREEEFRKLGWKGKPPDPQDETTFRNSKLNLNLKTREPHRTLLAFYSTLIRLRRKLPLDTSKEASVSGRTICMRRWNDHDEILMIYNFGGSERVSLRIPLGSWLKELDSADVRWRGEGSAVPQSLESLGETILVLAESSAVVLSRSF
ncbi:MAG TPA: malto-oligosyltrehalose trehalohydrolase [Candidatus Acidoferrales bacterium]|nr:malto-oligosyltrehalose trehalohydrolase [Candidatus Acidoferrales bacterium]